MQIAFLISFVSVSSPAAGELLRGFFSEAVIDEEGYIVLAWSDFKCILLGVLDFIIFINFYIC